MFVRTLIALATVALLTPPVSAGVASREVWHAVVVPPRPGLPAVTIDLGYPGPYISPVRSPITLHATAGNLPFDGYIGFHFAVHNARAFNVPIVSRAVIRPHQTWSFTTEADLHYFGELKREIVIEWWDRSMEVESTGNAGVPPWSVRARRLLVMRPGEAPSASLISDDESIERADALPDVARWYTGFRSVAIPLAVWLDLPRRVREAIFASGIYVVFSGLPAPSQRMDAIDRALLPVVFDQRPGSYEVPWPYRVAKAGPVAVPVSWRPKAGAVWTGSSVLPYIVSNQLTATWVADDTALNIALPAMGPAPIRIHDEQSRPPRVRSPAVRDLVRSFFPLIATILIALMSLGLWVVMRRLPRPVLAIVAVALSAVILLGRDRIRPAGHGFERRPELIKRTTLGGVYTYEIHFPLAPGVVDHFTVERIYGASPLPAKEASPEVLRTSITNADQTAYPTEIRDSATASGWGVIVRNQAWDAVSRSSERRELGETPIVRVRQRDATKLVVEYESPVAVDWISAEWVYGDTGYFGEAAASGGKSGTATIDSGVTLWSPREFPWRVLGLLETSTDIPLPAAAQGRPAFYTKVSLYQKTRSGTQMLQWVEPFPGADRKSGSFLIGGRLEGDANGTKSRLFALPVALIPSGARAVISVPKTLGARDVTVSCAAGSIKAIPTGHDGTRFATEAYAIPSEMFRQIIQEGGMLKVTLSPTQESFFQTAWVEVWEKKP